MSLLYSNIIKEKRQTVQKLSFSWYTLEEKKPCVYSVYGNMNLSFKSNVSAKEDENIAVRRQGLWGFCFLVFNNLSIFSQTTITLVILLIIIVCVMTKQTKISYLRITLCFIFFFSLLFPLQLLWQNRDKLTEIKTG